MSAHVLITANSAWGIAHFRRPVVAALRETGHKVLVVKHPGRRHIWVMRRRHSNHIQKTNLSYPRI
jgi:hydrogenase maturation factor